MSTYGLHGTDVIGYTADADIWCPECAALVYDRRVDGVLRTVFDSRPGFSGVDFEGNAVHPIFASDELAPGETCSRCRYELTEPVQCSANVGGDPANGCEEWATDGDYCDTHQVHW